MKINRVDFRYVYNRANKLNSKGQALLQQEFRIEKKKKYYSTGIYLKPNQWNGQEIVNHSNADRLNKKLNKRLARIIEMDPQSFEQIEAHFKGGNPDSFIEYFENYIEHHQGTYSTYKQYRSALNHLKRFGGIKTFSDLIPENIYKLTDYLHKPKPNKDPQKEPSKPLSPQTVYNIHKRYKPAVRLAHETGRIEKNPYDLIRFQTPKSKEIRYLTIEELTRLENWSPDSQKLERVKDVFLFSCYTGMSYSDLLDFEITVEGGDKWIMDKRQKTGEGFNVLLTKKALNILEKYDFKLPVYTNQVMNRYLEEVSYKAGIKKVTFHMARHTFAVDALNKGVPLEVVSRILGHSKISTTQVYAKVLKETIRFHMKKL